MKKLLFVLLLTISLVVHAQWTFVLDTNDETKFFIDNTTISQVNQFKRAWFKLEYSLNSEMSKVGVLSSRVYREFDCREKKVRNLSFTNFSQSNLLGDSTSSNKISDWSFIAPNTNAGRMLEIVCKTK
jgi:hypothetical protein